MGVLGAYWIKFSSFCVCSSSNPWMSQKPIRTLFSCKSVVSLNYLITNWKYSRKRCCLRVAISEKNSYSLNYVFMGTRRGCSSLPNTRRLGQLYPLASSNDGVTVNGRPQASTSSDVEEITVKLDRSLQGEDYTDGLVQSLHDAARICELAIKERSSQSKISWFTTAWLGVDRNSWVKTLSYQVYDDMQNLCLMAPVFRYLFIYMGEHGVCPLETCLLPY